MEFPSNSKLPATKKIEKREKPQKVIEGSATRRKKPLSQRITEFFVGDAAKDAVKWTLLEVLLPAAKDMIADAGTSMLERRIYGEAGVRPRGSRNRGGSNFTDYGKFSVSGNSRKDDDRRMSRSARVQHNFDEIVLDSRGEAEDVLEGLGALIERYETASVADLYELTGITPNHMDEKWGWTDTRGFGAQRVRNGGFLLNLPRPVELD